MTEHNSPTAMTDKRAESFRKAYAPLIASRLDNLHKMASDPMYAHQKENIALSIRLYEAGEIPKRFGSVWMANGKILEDAPKSVKKGDAIWAEVFLIIIPCYHVAYWIIGNISSTQAFMTLQRLCRRSMPHPAQPLFRIAVPSSAVQRFYRKILFHPTFLLLRVERETMPHPAQPLLFLLLQVAPHSFNQFAQNASYGILPESYTHEVAS